MVLAHGVVVAFHAQAEMAFVFAQLVGAAGMVAQPRQLEAESRPVVAQIGQHEAAVGGLLAFDLVQPQRLAVKGQAAVEVGDVDVEMVESPFDFHSDKTFWSMQM